MTTVINGGKRVKGLIPLSAWNLSVVIGLVLVSSLIAL